MVTLLNHVKSYWWLPRFVLTNTLSFFFFLLCFSFLFFSCCCGIPWGSILVKINPFFFFPFCFHQIPDYDSCKLAWFSMTNFLLLAQVLPYDQLMQELDVTNVRELEDFLINECMYAVGIHQAGFCIQPNYRLFWEILVMLGK